MIQPRIYSSLKHV